MRVYGFPLESGLDGVGIRPVVHQHGADVPEADGPVAKHNGDSVQGHKSPKGLQKRARSARPRSKRPADLDGAAWAIVEKLNRGVLVIDERGTVLFMNGAAELMFKRNTGLMLRGRSLAFEQGAANRALEQFLQRGCSTPDCPSLVLAVDGKKLKSPYRVLVSPLSDGASADDCAGRYSVFVYEPNGGHRELPISVLRRLYRLTPAEARLVNELFMGNSLADAAEARGISINTAKYTLKIIFQKCEVRSRAELMLLLSLGPRTL